MLKKYKLQYPLMFEGLQWTGENLTDVLEAFGNDGKLGESPFYPGSLTCKGGDSYLVVQRGDWILRDDDGNYYVCPGDVFHDNYEEVESQDESNEA